MEKLAHGRGDFRYALLYTYARFLIVTHGTSDH